MADIVRNEQGKFDAFTSLGCYPLIYLTADDAVLCPACANGENGSDASETHDEKQWRLTACDVYWEGPTIQCEHCQGDIESAYGDPDDTCRNCNADVGDKEACPECGIERGAYVDTRVPLCSICRRRHGKEVQHACE